MKKYPTDLPPSVELSQRELKRLLKLFPDRARQSCDLLTHLAQNRETPTDQAIKVCNARNLTTVVHRTNDRLIHEGYMVGCQRPMKIDRRVKPRNRWLWSVYKIPETTRNSVVDHSVNYDQTAR